MAEQIWGQKEHCVTWNHDTPWLVCLSYFLNKRNDFISIEDDNLVVMSHLNLKVSVFKYRRNVCHDPNFHLQQSMDDNSKRELSPVDATIVNGSKLVRSPKTDPIKMNRREKPTGLLLQISQCAAAPAALCKRRRAGWNGWYAAPTQDLLAGLHPRVTQYTSQIPKTCSPHNDQWLNH